MVVVPRVRSWSAWRPDELRGLHVEMLGGPPLAVRLGQQPARGDVPPVTVRQLEVGPLAVAEYAHNVDVAYRFHREDVYSLTFALSGRLTYRQRGMDEYAGPDRALVYHPDSGPMVSRSSAGRLAMLSLDSQALGTHLEGLLNRPVPSRLPLPPTISFTATPAWLRLFDLFRTALDEPGSILLHPIAAAPLCQALMTGMLLACDHPLREHLERTAGPCRPRTVQAVVDLVHAYPERPHTSVSLARHAKISVRSLQESFVRHLGMPPMTYLRQLRLARAHDDLRSGRAASVADAARRWGFTHLGRFSSAYRAKYGVAPSRTRS